MANSHVYSIDLDISTPQASKQALKELQTAFENSNQSMDALNSTYAELAKHTKDATELEKQYNKVVSKRLSDRDEEIDKLKAEKVAIAANRDLTESQKEEMIALKNAEIKRLEIDKKYIKAKEKEVKIETSLGKLIKSDLTGIKDKIKAQFQFIQALKTTEGRYKAIKKVAGGAGATALGLMGGAIASSGSLAEKEKALGSLKRGIDPALVDEVYVKTGADFPSIVQALNTMTDVTKDTGSLVQGAVLELQNPGAGKMLLSGTQQSSNDIQTLNNAIAQIKKQTGAQDMDAVIEAAFKSDLVTSGKVSQIDYLHAYSALAQHGLDEKTINSILSDTAQQEGDFIENLNKADLTQYVEGQDKTRMGRIELGLDKLDYDKAPEKTAAQSTVEKLRQFELKKDEILMNFMEPAVKVMEALEPLMDPLTTVINKLVPVVKWLAGVASNFVQNFVIPIVNKIADIFPSARKVKDTYNSARERDKAIWEGIKDTFNNARERDKAIWEGIKGFFSGGQNAQGGLITSPSIVGEAGPELVLPLDYSRAGRANQIINNFTTTQSFNLASNQSTPLALASAVGQNKFVQRSKVF